MQPVGKFNTFLMAILAGRGPPAVQRKLYDQWQTMSTELKNFDPAQVEDADNAAGKLLTQTGQSILEAQMSDGCRVADEGANARQRLGSIQEAAAVLQITDRYLSVVSDNLARMRELAAHAKCGNLSDMQKKLIQLQIKELMMMNKQIGLDARFRNVRLFEDGTAIEVAVENDEILSFVNSCIPSVRGDIDKNIGELTASLEVAAEKVGICKTAVQAGLNTLRSCLQKT